MCHLGMVTAWSSFFGALNQTVGAATTDNVTQAREKMLIFGQCPKESLNKNRITSDFVTIYRKLGVQVEEVARNDLFNRYKELNEQESAAAIALKDIM